jgi:superfamily I DNA/RNA helicase
MARILPDTPPRVGSSEVIKVFNALKKLPDEYCIWHNMNFQKQAAPDFLVLHDDGRAMLVMVSSATARDVKFAGQMNLLDSETVPLGYLENERLLAFINALEFPQAQDIQTLILFPNISSEQLHKQAPQSLQAHWVGRDVMQQEAGWDVFLTSNPLDDVSLEKLRQRFTPEVIVPKEMTVRPITERRREAGLTNYLLDYDQELAVKSDLDLPDEGQGVSSDFRLNIINGVAGSGKTLILLYRLRLLYRNFPNKRFLVLTHNRPLSHDMQSRFFRLEGCEPENIQWHTFNGWCRRYWPKDEKWINPLTIKGRQRVIEDVWRKHLMKDTTISSQMFQGEIDWLKDQVPMSRREYLSIDRRGRGFGLNADQRQRMFDAVVGYQKELEGRISLDWGDVPQRIWKFIKQGKLDPPQYDFILIDEAQFFAPLWIQTVLKLLTPNNSHLFIVADPTQGFLGRGTSWKSLGLEARGRTHLMRHSYRTTREIMDFATLLYRTRLSNERDDDILAPDLLNMPNGAFPQVISLTSPQDEIVRVANEVADFVRQGMPKRDLLVLHTNGVDDLIRAIEARLGKGSAIDPKETYPGDYVRVTTYNAGAGLESPIVFLAGLRDMFEEEQSLRLSDNERETVMRDNTRKLYMAATRAGQRLVITYVGEVPNALKELAIK